MKARIPLWLAAAVWIGSIGVAVWAQNDDKPEKSEKPDNGGLPTIKTEYPYLPNRYGELYFPSVAEWHAMQLTSLGSSTTRITQDFERQHLTCFLGQKGFVMTLDLLPMPEWKHYAGGGKFNAPAARVQPDIEKAVAASLRSLRAFFPEARDQDVTMRLFMRSEPIGTWEGGTLKLAAFAKPADAD